MKSIERPLIVLFLALGAAACGTNPGNAPGHGEGSSGSSGSGANTSGAPGQGPNSGTGIVKLTLRAK